MDILSTRRITDLAIGIAAAMSCCFIVASAQAQSGFKEREARLYDLVGDWRGDLFYIDYQSGEKQGIGQAAKITLSPDGAFLQIQSRFTDPGFDVYALVMETIDPATGDLLESFHRDHSIETMRFRVVSEEVMKKGWTLILVGQGKDDNRPATIRRTLIFTGDAFTRRKEVDYLDDEESDFIFRNETVMRRSDTPISFEDFRKQ